MIIWERMIEFKLEIWLSSGCVIIQDGQEYDHIQQMLQVACVGVMREGRMRWFDHMLRVPPYTLICMGNRTMIESDLRDKEI